MKRSEGEMESFIEQGERGSLKSAYLMYTYYYRRQDEAKAAEWKEKTRQIAEKASSDDLVAEKILQHLNRVDSASVEKTPTLSTEGSAQ